MVETRTISSHESIVFQEGVLVLGLNYLEFLVLGSIFSTKIVTFLVIRNVTIFWFRPALYWGV